jgi:antirestriction protein ArdC
LFPHSAEEYAAAKFHEISHSTGHPTRLNRDLDKSNGNRSEYSREELIAEMGASMLCALSGILERTIENSAASIQGWLSVLKADKKAVIVAAGAAQKATDLIYGNEEQTEERRERETYLIAA